MNTMVQHLPRHADVSFICHLAITSSYFAKHGQCDGMSYGPSLTDASIICHCDCHTLGGEAP